MMTENATNTTQSTAETEFSSDAIHTSEQPESVQTASPSPEKSATNKGPRGRNKPDSSFTPLKITRPASVRQHSLRTIEICSGPLLNNMVEEVEALNLMVFRLQRTFIAYRSPSSQKYFEAYFDDSLAMIHVLIKEELEKHNAILRQYQEQGYQFKFDGQPGVLEYTITNSRVDQLISVYLDLDKLLSTAIWLEKTSYWNITEYRAFQTEWMNLIPSFRANVKKLISRMQSQFKLTVKIRQPKPDRAKVDFEHLNEFLFKSRREYVTQFNKESDA